MTTSIERESTESRVQRPQVVDTIRASVAAMVAPRILKRLETHPTIANDWVWKASMDGWTITTDTGEHVTLRAGPEGITALDQLSCTCLLYPRCLHLIAVLSLLDLGIPGSEGISLDTSAAPSIPTVSHVDNPGHPLTEEPHSPHLSGHLPHLNDLSRDKNGSIHNHIPESIETRDSLSVSTEARVALSPAQVQALEQLQETTRRILYIGARGAGPLIHSELQRSIHTARACDLPRAATAAHRLLQQLGDRAGADGRGSPRSLRADLHELLDVCSGLLEAPGSATLARIGESRRSYGTVERLTLQGVLTWPITTITGYAGLVTLLLDPTGRAYTLPDIKPAERAQLDLNGRIGIGDLRPTFRELSSAQLFLQQVRISPDRRIGLGKTVRAAKGAESGWDSPCIQARFDVPAEVQLRHALITAALSTAEAPEAETLLFFRVMVHRSTREGVLFRIQSQEPGLSLFMEASSQPGAGSQHIQPTLELLREKPELPLRIIAKPVPGAQRQIRLLGIAADPSVIGAYRLELPTATHHHLSPGLERLEASWIRTDPRRQKTPAAQAAGSPFDEPTEPMLPHNPLTSIQRRLERCTQYGHSSLPISAGDELEAEARMLDALLMPGAARGLRMLFQAARRPAGTREEQARAAFQVAWLDLSRYERAASVELSMLEWLGSARLS